jgi:hypothetical protein
VISALQHRERAEECVRMSEDLLLHQPPFDVFDLRRNVHERQIGVDLSASRIAPITDGGSPPVRARNTAVRRRFCRAGTYSVGGAGSRRLSYFVSARIPTISSCPAISMNGPMC